MDAASALRADRGGVVEALRRYQARLPAHSEAGASLDRLADPRALVVTGGQQAGLFGGAMLIFYKALSVIRTARHAERLLGRPVVPVFWIAGEDHDFDEAGEVYVESGAAGVGRIRLERPPGPRRAVSRTPLDDALWQRALKELARQLPDSAFKPALLARLVEHAADAPTLTLAFARLLADWFGGQGLVLLDADDPTLRACEGPMFRRLIEGNSRLEEALQAGERAVAARGFPLQAESAAACANLFVHHEQGRLLLYRRGDRYADRRGAAAYGGGELLELADRAPELLSTNALSRPLMQEYALPVLAAVLGPSELAYWASLGPAFSAFGMQMPLLVPRQSFTYVEPGVGKLLERFGLAPERAIAEWESRKAEWLRMQSAGDETELNRRFRETKRQMTELYEALVAAVAAGEPGLTGLAERNRDIIAGQLAFLELRVRQAADKRHESSLAMWDRIGRSLCPLGKPQERIYGAVHFWNRYGPEWLKMWLDVPYEPSGGHWLVKGFAAEAATIEPGGIIL